MIILFTAKLLVKLQRDTSNSKFCEHVVIYYSRQITVMKDLAPFKFRPYNVVTNIAKIKRGPVRSVCVMSFKFLIKAGTLLLIIVPNGCKNT